MMQYGLAAAPLVRWLVAKEADVQKAVTNFIGEQTELDYADVAGPPTEADKARANGRAEVCPLPVVRLNFKMARHSLTGEPGVQVTCSEADLNEIERWWRLSRGKAAAS